MTDDDLVEIDSKVIGDDLRKGRLVPLAVRRGAREGGHRASRLHPHHRALEGTEAAHLDVDGHADAEELRWPFFTRSACSARSF